MSQLICLGLGYSAEHYVAAFGQKFDRIVGTMRSEERAAVLNAYDDGRLQALVFDGQSASPELQQAIVAADAALISIPQDAGGDPVLRACGDAIARAQHLRSIVYLSTIGVYGDRGGDWVDEETPPSPESARGRERLGGRAGLAGFRRAPRHRRCYPAPRRHLRAGAQRAYAGCARRCAPHRQARANLQPHSCRRHRAGDRCRVHSARRREFSTSPTTSRRRPAIRSSLRRSFSASRRRRKSPSPKPRRRCRRWR